MPVSYGMTCKHLPQCPAYTLQLIFYEIFTEMYFLGPIYWPCINNTCTHPDTFIIKICKTTTSYSDQYVKLELPFEDYSNILNLPVKLKKVNKGLSSGAIFYGSKVGHRIFVKIETTNIHH